MISTIAITSPVLEMISTMGPYGPLTQGVTPASAVTVGRTDYNVLVIPGVCVVRRFWWANGSDVAGARTMNVALYADSGFKPGARLGTVGSAAQSGANSIQFVAPSSGDFTIGPGRYWIAMTPGSTVTNSTMFASTLAGQVNAAGAYSEAVTTLPSTATPAEKTNATLFLYGFSTTTLV